MKELHLIEKPKEMPKDDFNFLTDIAKTLDELPITETSEKIWDLLEGGFKELEQKEHIKKLTRELVDKLTK